MNLNELLKRISDRNLGIYYIYGITLEYDINSIQIYPYKDDDYETYRQVIYNDYFL